MTAPGGAPERPTPSWLAHVRPSYAQPAYFDAIAAATESGTPDGAAIAAIMTVLLGIWDGSATPALAELVDRAYEAETSLPFGKLRNARAVRRGIEVIEAYGIVPLWLHLQAIGIDPAGDLAAQMGI
jgi:hypothetical protein